MRGGTCPLSVIPSIDLGKCHSPVKLQQMCVLLDCRLHTPARLEFDFTQCSPKNFPAADDGAGTHLGSIRSSSASGNPSSCLVLLLAAPPLPMFPLMGEHGPLIPSSIHHALCFLLAPPLPLLPLMGAARSSHVLLVSLHGRLPMYLPFNSSKRGEM